MQPGNQGQSILACVAERYIARLIQVNLERQGHRIGIADSGAEALSKLAEEPYDLAVLDQTLPDMSGRELMRRIRENPETAHIRVVLLRDKKSKDDDDDGPGPDLYLTTPFNPSQISDAVDIT